MKVVLLLAMTFLLTPAHARTQSLHRPGYEDEVTAKAEAGDPCMEWEWASNLLADQPFEQTEAFKAIAARGPQENPFFTGAAYELAVAHSLGRGLHFEALDSTVHWMKAAAEAGNPEAELWMGQALLFAPDGILPDYREAKGWLLRAAGHGMALAQALVGIQEAFGESGFDLDRTSAYRWLLLARASGHLAKGEAESVNQLIVMLEDEMDLRAVQAGQDVAQSWSSDRFSEVSGMRPVSFLFGYPVYVRCMTEVADMQIRHGFDPGVSSARWERPFRMHWVTEGV